MDIREALKRNLSAMDVREAIKRNLLMFWNKAFFVVVLVVCIFSLIEVGDGILAVLGYFFPLLFSTAIFLLAAAFISRSYGTTSNGGCTTAITTDDSCNSEEGITTTTDCLEKLEEDVVLIESMVGDDAVNVD